jgi:hypothetical protein
MLRLLLSLLVSCLLLCGCASEVAQIDIQNLAGAGAYTPQPYITVLAAPPATYIPIARLTATGSSGMTRDQLFAAVMEKARALGANAIIVRDESQVSAPSVAFNPAGGQYSIPTPTVIPKLSALAIHIDMSNSAPNE